MIRRVAVIIANGRVFIKCQYRLVMGQCIDELAADAA
jgi:hypothetical protein